jgi:hypothetical protein
MFTLNSIVPWGRSFDEYQQMFGLTDADLRRPILGCGDGPASFNAEATKRGASIVSCDPLYRFSADEIRGRIDETYADVIGQTRANASAFVWTTIGSLEELADRRMRAMQTFLLDFDAGKREGRYVDAGVPKLPFNDRSMPLALCSHFLFLYSSQLGEEFHVASVRELCRVADDVRIFPLLALGGTRSPYIDVCLDACRADGHDAQLVAVPYEFQVGGNQMMRIQRRHHGQSG